MNNNKLKSQYPTNNNSQRENRENWGGGEEISKEIMKEKSTDKVKRTLEYPAQSMKIEAF